jgi:anthranilate phosphoribosyltransferase
MKQLLKKLFNNEVLSRVEASELLNLITSGSATQTQIVAAISALKMRDVTIEELKGFRETLLENAVHINLNGKDAIDVCGTGGDSKNTFNISTLSAVVIAGAGYNVIKHGNYGVSSLCGSSTVMEALGYRFSNQEDNLQKQLDQSNLCFLHAPLFHPSLKKVGPIRKELGMRTFFNFLGPLVNPVQPAYQLTGVYNLKLMRIYKEMLVERTSFKIVHSLDGYDEVSLTSPFKVVTKKQELVLYPEDLGRTKLKQSDLYGGNSAEESSKIFKSILLGKGTAQQNEVVLTNAALGIQCFNPERKFEDCYAEASDSLMSMRALKSIEAAIAISNETILEPK